jgi:hypothetical protein
MQSATSPKSDMSDTSDKTDEVSVVPDDEDEKTPDKSALKTGMWVMINRRATKIKNDWRPALVTSVDEERKRYSTWYPSPETADWRYEDVKWEYPDTHNPLQWRPMEIVDVGHGWNYCYDPKSSSGLFVSPSGDISLRVNRPSIPNLASILGSNVNQSSTNVTKMEYECALQTVKVFERQARLKEIEKLDEQQQQYDKEEARLKHKLEENRKQQEEIQKKKRKLESEDA